MAYDYGRHFGEITLTQDLTTLPDERTWRLAAPGREPERHQIVFYLGCPTPDVLLALLPGQKQGEP